MKKKEDKPRLLYSYLCRGEANNTFVEHKVDAYDPKDAKSKFEEAYGSYFTDDMNYTFKIKEVI
jgi:hypothetical protein